MGNVGQAADDPVPLGEAEAAGPGAGRVLADEGPLPGHGLLKLLVPRGEDPVRAGAQHGDHGAAGKTRRGHLHHAAAVAALHHDAGVDVVDGYDPAAG